MKNIDFSQNNLYNCNDKIFLSRIILANMVYRQIPKPKYFTRRVLRKNLANQYGKIRYKRII